MCVCVCVCGKRRDRGGIGGEREVVIREAKGVRGRESREREFIYRQG